MTLVSIGIILTQILCEVSKQLSNYSIQYLNRGVYPVPQTVLILLGETIKWIITVLRSKGSLCLLFESILRFAANQISVT